MSACLRRPTHNNNKKKKNNHHNNTNTNTTNNNTTNDNGTTTTNNNNTNNNNNNSHFGSELGAQAPARGRAVLDSRWRQGHRSRWHVRPCGPLRWRPTQPRVWPGRSAARPPG